jgi:hypothetical protein
MLLLTDMQLAKLEEEKHRLVCVLDNLETQDQLDATHQVKQ